MKHDSSFPKNTIEWLMKTYNVTSDNLHANMLLRKTQRKIK